MVDLLNRKYMGAGKNPDPGTKNQDVNQQSNKALNLLYDLMFLF